MEDRESTLSLHRKEQTKTRYRGIRIKGTISGEPVKILDYMLGNDIFLKKVYTFHHLLGKQSCK